MPEVSGKRTDGPVSRYINRRISRAVSRLILESGVDVTPNQVTLVVFAISLVASALIAAGRLVLGGILVQLSSVLDGVDGEIARATGRSTRKGAFLDTMLDRYSNILFIAATVLVASGSAEPSVIALAGVAAVSGDIMVSYLHAKGRSELGVHPALVGPLDSAASRDVRLLLLAVFLVLRMPLVGLIVLAVLSHIYVAVKTIYLLVRVE